MNKKELQVLKACQLAALKNNENGGFNTDDIYELCQYLTKHEIAGYLSDLQSKKYIDKQIDAYYDFCLI